MATELYGVDAQLVSSIGATPVSTETNVIFIGASPSGELNKAHLITSMSDYAQKLGGAPGDGYNLTEAAIAAFQIAGIRKVYMIPVSHTSVLDSDEYIGDPALYTGVYAIEKLFMDTPTAVNIICAPSVSDDDVIAALDGIAKLSAGHWQSFLMYDLPQSTSQINQSGVAQASAIAYRKSQALIDGHALAVWGSVKTSGGYVVSGAAVRACLQAKSDADYDAPGRSGGNLAIPGIQGVVILTDPDVDEIECDRFQISPGTDRAVTNLKSDNADIIYDSNCIYTIYTFNIGGGLIDKTKARLVNNSGVLALETDRNSLTGTQVTQLSIAVKAITPVTLPEATATELSADGVCSYIYYGNGVYHTWGDHTSLFAGGTVSDELYRFDNYIRMQMMILNRFQLAHRFEIDNPMDLSMRNDITNYELDQLNRLKARGVLIGNPVVEFRPENNSTSDLQLGRFVWSFECTETPPAKYLKAEIAYTTAGLSVLTSEE